MCLSINDRLLFYNFEQTWGTTVTNDLRMDIRVNPRNLQARNKDSAMSLPVGHPTAGR